MAKHANYDPSTATLRIPVFLFLERSLENASVSWQGGARKACFKLWHKDLRPELAVFTMQNGVVTELNEPRWTF